MEFQRIGISQMTFDVFNQLIQAVQNPFVMAQVESVLLIKKYGSTS